MLKEILVAARERCWEFGRHGEGEGGREVSESEFNAGSNWTQYAGTGICDAQVGELSCVET